MQTRTSLDPRPSSARNPPCQRAESHSTSKDSSPNQLEARRTPVASEVATAAASGEVLASAVATGDAEALEEVTEADSEAADGFEVRNYPSGSDDDQLF